MARAATRRRGRREAARSRARGRGRKSARARKRTRCRPRRGAPRSCAAALDEFTARGYEGARLDDVARRAGVAKGTIYLYFADKETLFQELVRSMVSPVLGTLEQMREVDIPARMLVEGLLGTFVREVYGTRRKDIIRLIMAEGPRFPAIAEFYYGEVIARVLAIIRPILRRAAERGELRDDSLARFPQLIVAPMLVGDRVERAVRPVRAARVDAMIRAHVGILFAGRRVMKAPACVVLLLGGLALAACGDGKRPAAGLGRGGFRVRRTGRGGPHRGAACARGRHGRGRRAAVRGRFRAAVRRSAHGVGAGRRSARAARHCARRGRFVVAWQHEVEIENPEGAGLHGQSSIRARARSIWSARRARTTWPAPFSTTH